MNSLSAPTYRERLVQVQLYIQQNLDGDLSLDRLAQIAHFSPCHFHRIFRGVIGEGVHEHVRRLRLESAAMALKSTQREIVQIALHAGYAAHEAFTRAFRQMFGVSPSQYRAGQQPSPHPLENDAMQNANPPATKIESHPARRVLFLRHVGPYMEVAPTWQKLMGHAFRKGLVQSGPLVLGICHDDPEVTPADKLRYDCAVTVADSVEAEGEFGIQAIDGGDFAVARHVGPYENLKQSYQWLFGVWLPASGREPRNAPCFEVYRNNPSDTKPQDLITDIFLPLAPN